MEPLDISRVVCVDSKPQWTQVTTMSASIRRGFIMIPEFKRTDDYSES